VLSTDTNEQTQCVCHEGALHTHQADRECFYLGVKRRGSGSASCRSRCDLSYAAFVRADHCLAIEDSDCKYSKKLTIA
jgi:hypothetical protein